jgi:hypothetical protein
MAFSSVSCGAVFIQDTCTAKTYDLPNQQDYHLDKNCAGAHVPEDAGQAVLLPPPDTIASTPPQLLFFLYIIYYRYALSTNVLPQPYLGKANPTP